MMQECQEEFAIRIAPVINSESKGELYSPTLDVTRISPVEYKIRTIASEPYILVFNESYNPFWKIWVNDGQEIQPVIVNGFANGYYIDEPGPQEIRLYYSPQTLFVVGGVVSIFAIVICLIAVCSFSYVNRNNRTGPMSGHIS